LKDNLENKVKEAEDLTKSNTPLQPIVSSQKST
jgi:hypothetical protein